MSERSTRPAGRALRVLRPPSPGPWGSSALGAVTAVPWCCVVPAALAALGLASSVLAGWVRSGTPAFLLISAGFLGRAHYLIWVKRHGSKGARVATLALTLAVAWMWVLRLAPLLSGGLR